MPSLYDLQKIHMQIIIPWKQKMLHKRVVIHVNLLHALLP